MNNWWWMILLMDRWFFLHSELTIERKPLKGMVEPSLLALHFQEGVSCNWQKRSATELQWGSVTVTAPVGIHMLVEANYRHTTHECVLCYWIAAGSCEYRCSVLLVHMPSLFLVGCRGELSLESGLNIVLLNRPSVLLALVFLFCI